LQRGETLFFERICWGEGGGMPTITKIERLVAYLMEGKMTERDLANFIKNQIYQEKIKK
jgi:hypothetical protein